MIGVRRHAPFCCAICAADITPPLVRAPLGKGGALVIVCASCENDRAKERYGTERSYEGSGGLPTFKESRRSMRDDAAYQAAVQRDIQFGKTPSAPLGEAERLADEYRHDSMRRARAAHGDPARQRLARPPRRPR